MEMTFLSEQIDKVDNGQPHEPIYVCSRCKLAQSRKSMGLKRNGNPYLTCLKCRDDNKNKRYKKKIEVQVEQFRKDISQKRIFFKFSNINI